MLALSICVQDVSELKLYNLDGKRGSELNLIVKKSTEAPNAGAEAALIAPIHLDDSRRRTEGGLIRATKLSALVVRVAGKPP